jgi:hypothetical protein
LKRKDKKKKDKKEKKKSKDSKCMDAGIAIKCMENALSVIPRVHYCSITLIDVTEKRKNGMQLVAGPHEPRHVGGMQNIMLGDPLAQQSKFNVEVKEKFDVKEHSKIYCCIHEQFLTVMPVEGRLRSISPLKSIRKVRDLFKRGDIEKVEVLLSISPMEIIIKDGSTRVYYG